jgi:hypothetical protein
MIREIFEADSFSADAACALWARRINCSTVSVLPTCGCCQEVEIAGALLMVTGGEPSECGHDGVALFGA